MPSKLVLRVKVNEGRDLEAPNKDHSPNPYILLQLGNQSHKTRTLRGSSNVTWNETFKFFITPDNVHEKLLVVCWDHYKSDVDDIIGGVEIGLDDLLESPINGQWFRFETNDRDEAVPGEINMDLELVDVAKNGSRISSPAISKPVATTSSLLKEEETNPDEEMERATRRLQVREQLTSQDRSVSLPQIHQPAVPSVVTKVPSTSEVTRSPNAQQISQLRGSVGRRSSSQPTITGPHDKPAAAPQTEPINKPGRRKLLSNEFKSLFSSKHKRTLSNSKNPTAIVKPNEKELQPTPRIGPVELIRFQIEHEGKLIATDLEMRTDQTVSDLLEKIASQCEEIPKSSIDLYEIYWTQNIRNKILKRDQQLAHYKLGANPIVRIAKPEGKKIESTTLPFKNFHEKYGLDPRVNPTSSRSDEELLFEFAMHCLFFPLTKNAPRTRSRLIYNLRESLHIPNETYEPTSKRISKFGQSDESILVELEHRIATLDKNPFYKPENFPNVSNYESWKKSEVRHVCKLIDQILFPEHGFNGLLTTKVVGAKHITSKPQQIYVVLKVQAQKKMTPTIQNSPFPVWDKLFQFDVSNAARDLIVEVWGRSSLTSDELLGKASIPIIDLKTANPDPRSSWFNLGEGRGSIRLELKLEYANSKYAHIIEEAEEGHLRQANVSVVDHNTLYDLLARCLMEEVNSPDKPAKELSPEAVFLLNEYATRYGVGSLFTKITYIKYIHLQPHLDLLLSVERALVEISEFSIEDFTIAEKDMMKIATQELLAKVEDMIRHYNDLFFRNVPNGAMTSLVGITILLCGSKLQPAYNLLAQWFRAANERRYKAILASIQKYREPSDNKDMKLKAGEATTLIIALQEQITNDAYFQDILPAEIDFLPNAAKIYSSMLTKDLEVMDQSDTKNFLELFSRLTSFESFVVEKTGKDSSFFRFIDVSQFFLPFIYGWLKDTDSKMKQFVADSIKKDKKQSISDDQLHSKSVEKVFSELRKEQQFLDQLKNPEPFFVAQFGEIVIQCTKEYIKHLESEVTNGLSGIRGSLTSNTKPNALITPEICVLLNNLEAARINLNALASDLQKKMERACKNAPKESADIMKQNLEDGIKDGIHHILTERQVFIQSIAFSLDPWIRKQLISSCNIRKSKGEKPLDDLFGYLDKVFETCYDNLYPTVFKKMLQYMWLAVAQAVRNIAIPEGGSTISLQTTQADLLLKNFEELRDYFHASGSGLSEKYLDEQAQLISSILQFSQKKSKELIDIYNFIKLNKDESAIMKITYIKRILQSRSDKDKDASCFLKEISDDKSQIKNQKVREQFQLPSNEFALHRYNVNMGTKLGDLHLTTSYVLFDSLIGGKSRQNQVVIPLTEIKLIKRTTHMLYDSVEISTVDSKYTFSSMTSREQMVQDILDQASKVGNKSIKPQ